MTNNQNNSYQIYFDKIPLSSNLKSVINSKNLLKKNLISNGDDYQVLFTANYRYRSFIKKISSLKKLKITLIGKILHSRHKSSIIDRKDHQIKISNKGYTHKFD